MKKNKTYITKISMTNINILIFVIVFLFVILIFGLLFIQKADTVEGSFKVYSSNIPRTLKSKVDGEVIFIKSDKDIVMKNTDIAFIKTSSDYYQVRKLEQAISFGTIEDIKSKLINQNFTMLGELASHYYDLIHSFDVLNNQKDDDVHKLDAKQTEILLISYKKSYQSQKNNYKLEKEQLRIAEQTYHDDSTLYSKNAITRITLDNSRNNYITHRKQVEESYSQLSQIESKIKDTKTSDTKIGAQQNSKLISERNDTQYYLQILKAEIKEWRYRYVLTTPCQGKVEFITNMENGQIINMGTEVVNIIPSGKDVKAIIMFSTMNSAEVKIGSPVKLFFDNYDKISYGYIIANISKKSSTISTSSDGSTFYTGELKIDLSKQGHFIGKLTYDEGMSGKASIIVKRKCLFQKIFNWINLMTD